MEPPIPGLDDGDPGEDDVLQTLFTADAPTPEGDNEVRPGSSEEAEALLASLRSGAAARLHRLRLPLITSSERSTVERSSPDASAAPYDPISISFDFDGGEDDEEADELRALFGAPGASLPSWRSLSPPPRLAMDDLAFNPRDLSAREQEFLTASSRALDPIMSAVAYSADSADFIPPLGTPPPFFSLVEDLPPSTAASDPASDFVFVRPPGPLLPHRDAGRMPRPRRVDAETEDLDEHDLGWDMSWTPEEMRARIEAEEARQSAMREAEEVTRVWRNHPVDIERVRRVARGGTIARHQALYESADELEWRRRSEAPPPINSTSGFNPLSYYRPRDFGSRMSLGDATTSTSTSNLTAALTAEQHLETLRSVGESWEYWGTSGTSDWAPPLPLGQDLLEDPESGGDASASATNDRGSIRGRRGAVQEQQQRRQAEDDAETTALETNALIGHALRTKKDCLLLYCGARREALPAGFHYVDSHADEAGGGCGVLVCARGLGGVSKKVFESLMGEEDAISSDLPPPNSVVSDVEIGPELKGTRGVIGCHGCMTKEIGCRSCGNVLGYRVVRSCTPCGKSRVVSSDGLLWHYRSSAVTTVDRLNGIPPAAFINLESSGDSGNDEPAPPPRTSVVNPRTGRLELKEPDTGSKMKWVHAPSPQLEFEDGLIGEPGEWVSSDTDSSWLDGLARHCRRGRPLRRETTRTDFFVPSWERVRAGEHSSAAPPNPDSVFTQLQPDPPRSRGSGDLTRSFAIRIPPYHSPNTGSSSARNGDRRVRQRTTEDVERAVTAVGYGSAFVRPEQALQRERERERARRMARRRSMLAASAGGGLVGR